MTKDQISDLVAKLGDIIGVLGDADPADRAEVYQQLGLRLTYHPREQKVRVQAQPDADLCGEMVRVRGVIDTITHRSQGWNRKSSSPTPAANDLRVSRRRPAGACLADDRHG